MPGQDPGAERRSDTAKNQDLNSRLTKATDDLAETQSTLQATRQAAMILEAQTKAKTDTLENLLTKTRGLDGDPNKKSLVDNKGLSVPKVFDSDAKSFMVGRSSLSIG